MADAREVVVERLGGKGDGVAMLDGETVYVPFGLPGERWTVGVDGDERVSDSACRVTPLCRHFLACGGCIAQHMSDGLYRDWKRGLVAEAFRHRGLEVEVAPLVAVGPGTRRRAYFGIERRGVAVRIGFREEGQHTLVDLSECPVLDPSIVTAVPGLRAMAAIAMTDRVGGRLLVTKLDHGLDVAFENGRRDLSPADRAELAAVAQELGFLRLTVAGEPIMSRGRPVVTLGGVEVEVTAGVFLQAIPEVERLLAELCLSALPKSAKNVADLFCGIGTLTLPLARRAAITGYDSDRRAIGALAGAVRHAQGLKPITAVARDLFRDPLSARELSGFDAVVLDPPRAGASEQVERLAKSKVPLVLAVSCNPATLARDARTLIDGGYNMSVVTPIDQFVFSAHVEAFAVLRR